MFADIIEGFSQLIIDILNELDEYELDVYPHTVTEQSIEYIYELFVVVENYANETLVLAVVYPVYF